MADVKSRKIKKPKTDVITKKDESEKNNTNMPKSSLSQQRILVRVVVVCSLSVIVYIMSGNKENKIITFAKQSEHIQEKGKAVECADNYLKEINSYEGCFPKHCGRFVSDQVISEKEAQALLLLAIKGLNFGGSSGGASILDIHSGALSKGKQFINIYKIEQAKNLFTEQEFILYRVVKEKIKYTIAHYFDVYPDKIYLTSPTFFSRLTADQPATIHDEYWHPHVDKETYKSFHYTSLLYLNDYNRDFEGGRFVFIDNNVNTTVEPRKGRLSLFTSGSENTHFVEKVTNGVRFAITISFTCDQRFSIQNPDVTKYN